MLSIISGLFAACQYRLSLLIALSISSLISLAYNVLLILWYNGIFGDRTRPILSAGLPFSYSFFLRYTPIASCQSHFNLTTAQWVQSSACVLPYYNIESLQALLHSLVALLTMVLAIALACSRPDECRTERRTKTISMEFSGAGSGSACLIGNHNVLPETRVSSRPPPSKASESIRYAGLRDRKPLKSLGLKTCKKT